MVKFLHARRWIKKKENQFSLRNAFNIHKLRLLVHFDAENYTWRLDIVFLHGFFEAFCLKIYIKQYSKQFSTKRLDIVENLSGMILTRFVSKYLKEFSTQRLDIAQNVLILSSPKSSWRKM